MQSSIFTLCVLPFMAIFGACQLHLTYVDDYGNPISETHFVHSQVPFQPHPQIVSVPQPPYGGQNLGIPHHQQQMLHSQVPFQPHPQIVSVPQPPYGGQNLGIPHHQQQMPSPRNSMPCRNGEKACSSLNQCIPEEEFCDGTVNCSDGSDEVNCTCVSRLNKKKICDDFVDCPNGEDESECDMCGQDSYSCYFDNKCYPKSTKCDGTDDCGNGHDEDDCNLLTTSSDFVNVNSFVRSTEGILLKNHRNTWYPICGDAILTSYSAVAACRAELGEYSTVTPTRELTTYNGPFIELLKKDGFSFRRLVQRCYETSNYFVHVNCSMNCGTYTKSASSGGRISGGRKSDPLSHPWIAALYLNGSYQCTGSIIGKSWIITAAHCFYNNEQLITEEDYLQVRVGFKRQDSFSPNEQFVRVRRILIHNEHKIKTFLNDIALVELEKPLFFNRYTQPICLPSKERIGNGADGNWMLKPEAGTICYAAGWGVLTMRGLDPVDSLMEVELPITADNKCVSDNKRITCAGSLGTASAVCQGDSGGPLVCETGRQRDEFFLNGIWISAYNPNASTQEKSVCGDGNTVSAFTKVSLYVADGWIENAMKNAANSTEIWTQSVCPGVSCKSNGRCAIKLDGIVECLNGEDEII